MTARRVSAFWIPCSLLLPAACLEIPEHGRSAPFGVAAVDPPGGSIGRAQSFRLSFTRPVDRGTIRECAAALVPSESLDEKVVAAFMRSELPAAVAAVVECGHTEAAETGAEMAFSPARTLRPGGAYRLVVSGAISDAHGAKLGDALDGPYVGERVYVVPGAAAAADLIINEVMANPRGDEARSEYFELHNPADAPVDMEFFSLSFKDGPVQEIRACGGATVVAPGGYGLVGGGDFTLPEGVAAPAACVKGRLGGRGVVNYAGQVVELRDPKGRVTSAFTGWLASKTEGRSLERIDSAAPDDGSNWGFSTESGGTPGRENSISAVGRLPAPRLLKFDPSGGAIDPASQFSFLFSRAISCGREEGCVAFLESAAACGTGAESRVKGAEYHSAGILTLSFRPHAALDAQTTYFVELRGLSAADGGEAGEYCLPIETGLVRDTTPPRALLVQPQDGTAGVPTNIRAIEVGFDEPVTLAPLSVRMSGGGSETALECEPVGPGTAAVCLLERDLLPDAQYSVEIQGPGHDTAGNVIARAPLGNFWTGAGADEEAPGFLAELISAVPGGFTAAWTSSEPCRARYVASRFGSGDPVSEGAVSGFSTTAVFALALSPGTDGLEVEVFCEDPSGNLSNSGFVHFGPEALASPVSISEVLAGTPAAGHGGEFVELVNFGGVPINVAGWIVARCGETDAASVVPESGRTVLAPGERLLLVNENDAGSFAWGAKVVEVPGGIVPGGLRKGAPERICLRHPAGAAVSSFSPGAVPARGRSFERISDDAIDAPAAWVESSAEGGTPGTPRSALTAH